MSEVGQCASRAAVYTENGGWQPADSGLSNIDVYLNPSTASYRVVALDTNNPSSVSINSNVWADLTYQKASSTFHQWRDQAGKTYGLNFASQSDADTFERGITAAVNKLKQGASSGGAGAMAGLNLMSRESANNGPRPAAQRSSVGQGAQMRGGAQMMMTMPKDMGAAFDQQREADIAAFRQMSAARKAAPAPAPARAPPSPQLSPHSSGPPPVPTASKKSPLSEDTSSSDNNNGYNGDDSYGGGGDTSNDYGGGGEESDYGGGGDGGGDEEFTDAEIEAWRDSVIEAVRAEIETVKQELVEAVQQYYGGGGGGGGGGDWNGGGGGW